MNNEQSRVQLLMVDDEIDFLESTSKALDRRGIEVHTATCGSVALEMVQQHDFDVVVLDIKMPGMDGLDVFERLRREYPHLPIIMLTGHGTVGHAFQTSKKGVFDFIDKPCDLAILAERVLEAASQGKNQKPEIVEKSGPLEPVDPIHVLIVDDEREFLDSLKNVLERRKMKVTLALNGADALHALKETLIDVVVLDVKLPGMSGLEVLGNIKNQFENVEVLLLTGHPTISTAVEGLNLGAAKYIEKPPDIEELTTTIRWCYQKRQEKIEKQQKKLIEDIRRRYPE